MGYHENFPSARDYLPSKTNGSHYEGRFDFLPYLTIAVAMRSAKWLLPSDKSLRLMIASI
jgi:hypothetical protein